MTAKAASCGSRSSAFVDTRQVPRAISSRVDSTSAASSFSRERTPDATHCAWQPWWVFNVSTSAGATDGPIRSSSAAASTAAA